MEIALAKLIAKGETLMDLLRAAKPRSERARELVSQLRRVTAQIIKCETRRRKAA